MLSVNDVSLFNKTRHDAVELVKECESEVKLEVLRFPSITEVLATNNNNSNMSRIDVKDNDAGTTTNGKWIISFLFINMYIKLFIKYTVLISVA